ncbi:MAG TPA: DbpA RNA binding domain-containing protein [Longimicrobiales bacterium]|nr:DbpA RNA binding domain-containing protein [Longimicrobiales bacterium]
MAQSLAELGIREDLAAAAEAAGIVEATPIQAAAMPVLRRGGNAVLHASSGAGVTAAWGLPLFERLLQEPATGDPRALVLAPTEERATRLAHALARFGSGAGLRIRALGGGWNRHAPADVLITTPAAALDAVEHSTLKLDALVAAIITEFDVMHKLGGSDAVDTLTALLPRDAQRVVTAAEITESIDHYLEAHVRRALVIPARPADARERSSGPAITGVISFAIAPDEHKEEILVRLLDGRTEARPVVVTRGEAGAALLRAALALRGFDTADAAEGVRVEAAPNAPATGASVSYDVPFDAEMLRALHRNGGVVLAAPREMPHLRRIAAEAGFALEAERVEPHATDALAEYRRTVKQAIHGEDIDAQLAVLDPLFQEFSAAEVAAALSALLRRRTPAAAARPAAPAGAAPPATVTAGAARLFISLGSKDNIRPADLVGAITNEAGVKGDQIGKIDIRETFSVVEIEAAVADRVIRALNGTTVRGRSVRVDYDRKGAPSPARRPAGPPRRRVPRERDG